MGASGAGARPRGAAWARGPLRDPRRRRRGRLAGAARRTPTRCTSTSALDIFLTTRLHGQGLGREALRLAIAHYLERGHHRFTIDPAAHNERAIRTYSAVGFKPVGRMRDYELGADGTWHDGLLMDLLASEFVSADA